jgi:MFS transporter, DHA3 family, macrolide efflux protein
MDKGSTWKRNTTFFLTSQTISLFGSMLVQYAILWYITLETQSGVMMMISIIAGFLPTFFISPFAGVWADRYNRKTIIIWSDFLIAFSTLILAILFMMGYDPIWMLFVTSAIRAFGTGIQTPAVGAFLPQIVPEEKLMKVNGVKSGIQSMVMLVCPMLSGALLAVASIEVIFFLDVVTAMLAIGVMVFFLPVPPHAKALEVQTSGYFEEMAEGVRYIRQHRFVKTFFVFCTFFFFLASPVAFLTPLQVTRTFGPDVWRLTAIEIVFSVGMMVGGFAIASWGGFRNRTHTMIFSAVSIGLGTVALGVLPNFWIYLVFMGLIGLVMPAFNTPATVLLQEKVESDYMGRVFGVLEMISSIVMPAGMLLFGPLADLIRIEGLLIVTGALLFIQGLLMFRNTVMIEAGAPL